MMTRTDRRRTPILLAAAVALLALFGSLALPATVQAQTPPAVLVSNTGQGDGIGSFVNDTSLGAQAFSVPSGGGDYTLTSIEFAFDDDISSTNIGSLGCAGGGHR